MNSNASNSTKTENILESDAYRDFVQSLVELSKLPPEVASSPEEIANHLGIHPVNYGRFKEAIYELAESVMQHMAESDIKNSHIFAKNGIEITHKVEVTVVKHPIENSTNERKTDFSFAKVASILAVLSVNTDQISDNLSKVLDLLRYILNMLE